MQPSTRKRMFNLIGVLIVVGISSAAMAICYAVITAFIRVVLEVQ